ncbi:MAG: SDR family NAD(P)-dependent oxidoreductase, partial [Actinomycetota bacterium]
MPRSSPTAPGCRSRACATARGPSTTPRRRRADRPGGTRARSTVGPRDHRKARRGRGRHGRPRPRHRPRAGGGRRARGGVRTGPGPGRRRNRRGNGRCGRRRVEPRRRRGLRRRCPHALGGVDIVVANAGGPPGGGFDDFPDSRAYADAFALNALSTIAMCQEAVPEMRARRWGRIVAV